MLCALCYAICYGYGYDLDLDMDMDMLRIWFGFSYILTILRMSILSIMLLCWYSGNESCFIFCSYLKFALSTSLATYIISKISNIQYLNFCNSYIKQNETLRFLWLCKAFSFPYLLVNYVTYKHYCNRINCVIVIVIYLRNRWKKTVLRKLYCEICVWFL